MKNKDEHSIIYYIFVIIGIIGIIKFILTGDMGLLH